MLSLTFSDFREHGECLSFHVFFFSMIFLHFLSGVVPSLIKPSYGNVKSRVIIQVFN